MTIYSSGRPRIRSVIFDLDGTLIDSAASITAGLDIAFRKAGVLPALPLNPCLVGPPLGEIMQKLVGKQIHIDMDVLALNFKSYYDSEGFKASIPYPGVQGLLDGLTQMGIAIYLATNKRMVPVLKILEHLGWTPIFNRVYTIDKFNDSPFNSKVTMIEALIESESIKKECALYVGDRMEDFESAFANGIDAVLVNWGYGDFESNSTIDGIQYANSPEELFRMIVSHK